MSANRQTGDRWTVRDVPKALQDAAKAAADKAGMKLGPWLTRAVEAALGSAETSFAGMGNATQSQLDALSARVAALEALTTMPMQKGKRTTRPKAEPRPSDAPLLTGDDSSWIVVQGKRRVLTEAGKAEVYRRMAAGETDPQIAHAVGLTQQGINKWRQKWRKENS